MRNVEKKGRKTIDRIRGPRQRFIELRKEIGSQRHVASLLGVTEFQLRKIENGYGDPSVLMLFVFVQFFKVTIEEIFPEFAEDARVYLASL